MHAPNPNYGTIRWMMISQLLLAIYLGFFNAVLGKSPTEIFYIGVGFAILATVVVVLCRNVFFNKFEYRIHLVIGLDIFFESLIPWHETLGFYYCALAFWSLFWSYHAFLLYRRRSRTRTSAVASDGASNMTV